MRLPIISVGGESESDDGKVAVSTKPRTFLLSTNTDVGLASTDHTSAHRPNLEDDANRVPIFGPEPLDGANLNKDCAIAQLLPRAGVARHKRLSAAFRGRKIDIYT